MEYAPSTSASTSTNAASTDDPRLTERATSSATKSESDSIDVTWIPATSARWCVFVKLPLCPRANIDSGVERKTGCAAVQFADPEVE